MSSWPEFSNMSIMMSTRIKRCKLLLRSKKGRVPQANWRKALQKYAQMKALLKVLLGMEMAYNALERDYQLLLARIRYAL